jgi:uncharacterized protein (DUF1697 family)
VRIVADRRVALLRGVNVGRAKRVQMADLRALFETLGYGDVRTLLNSGNVTFTVANRRTVGEAARIERAIADRLGVATRVTVLTAKELAEAIRENPLAAVVMNPSRMLVMALQDVKAVAAVKALLVERWAPEVLALRKQTAYLWCANGIAAGRLWTAVERAVGDGGTARNLATMTRLLAMTDAP